MRLSLLDRCFRAADRWMSNRLYPPDLPADEAAHVGYRCGWYAGYQRAKREVARNKR